MLQAAGNCVSRATGPDDGDRAPQCGDIQTAPHPDADRQAAPTVSEHAVEHIEGLLSLLENDATVPFIARYRKEVTGALDDTQMRQLEERLYYLREMEDRRQAILNSIIEQGKVDTLLQASAIDQVSLECHNSKVPMELIGLLDGKDVLAGAIDVDEDRWLCIQVFDLPPD